MNDEYFLIDAVADKPNKTKLQAKFHTKSKLQAKFHAKTNLQTKFQTRTRLQQHKVQ